TEEEVVEETVEGCGEGCGETVTDETTEEETVATEGETTEPEGPLVARTDDPRVVLVAGEQVRLPRLPFFGCDDVTTDDWMTVIEEIIRNPEN
ncbi:MAG: hypothetical protein OER88_08050, partial [Planctomycetota bacterium]|nr:hypothetical protein [Planctomycetota bacterium]